MASPNSSTTPKNNVEPESTDSEFALGKKKKKHKKKIVIESEDESSKILHYIGEFLFYQVIAKIIFASMIDK